MGQSFLDLVWA